MNTTIHATMAQQSNHTKADNMLPIATDNIATYADGTSARGHLTPENKTPVDMRLADCGACYYPGWQIAWAQVIGCRHPKQTEDSVASASYPVHGHALGKLHALCVAVGDGVSGGSRGDMASQALTAHCVTMPAELIGHPQAMVQWMLLAEGQVQIKLREVTNAPGATTLAAAWLQPAWHHHADAPAAGYIMRVGDARLYRFDGQTMAPLTTDQTYASLRETPPDGAGPDDPACMVGTGFMGLPELMPVTLPLGHTLLLCSDGLHRGLTSEQMAKLMQGDGDLAACALRLAQAARTGGSDDDITVMLAQAHNIQKERRSLLPSWCKVRQWFF